MNIDTLFAQKFGGGAFLEALLASAREGHLCLQVGEEVFPSFGERDEEIRKLATPIRGVVVQKNERFYLKRNWELEQRFLHHFKRLLAQEVEALQVEDDPSLDPEQMEAVRTALCHPLTLISGGPGTGKSFTATKIIENFKGSVAVAAPTGKAAANLRHLDCPVKTLHSLLSKRLYYDLVVVDEGSMIDAELMTKLFAAVQGRLVILGDRDQLPPIATGHFFSDLTTIAPCCYLNKCHRAELQEIVDIAKAVKEGKSVPYEPLENFKEKPDDVTLLTPLRKGPYGVERLNERFYKPGRVPIMITENAQGLVNGETGWLEEGQTSWGMPESMLPKYEYAYALSVHKSQGSEYDRVWLLLPPGSERFGREMLYTAITRARKEIRIFAAENVLEQCVERLTQRVSLST
ncbi:MAG: AAA family ATPase [Chlamydiales bacterium]|nr:AAA family ATPase [Chlamydiales bacterium]